MSITIELKHKQLDSQPPLKMHYLPAKIIGDGEANVEEFFEKYTEIESRVGDCEQFINALRGFPLKGEECVIPKGYKGFVLQETHETLSEDANRILKVAGSFEKFYYWNYDKMPSKADPYKQALQMLDISKELATEFTEDEVLVEIAKNKESGVSKEN